MAGDYSRIHHPGDSGRNYCRSVVREHALLQDQRGFPAYMGQRLSELLRLNRVTDTAPPEQADADCEQHQDDSERDPILQRRNPTTTALILL